MLSARKDRLVSKREEKKLSQHKLSILSGLSGNAIFRMENTNHRVNSLRAKAVAEALGCSVDELFVRSITIQGGGEAVE